MTEERQTKGNVLTTVGLFVREGISKKTKVDRVNESLTVLQVIRLNKFKSEGGVTHVTGTQTKQ